MKIAISATENSGDLLASQLITELKKQTQQITIYGLAGDKMHASGCIRTWEQKLVNVMGFTEVIKKLPSLIALRKTIIKRFINDKPDVFIGVDAPDFNFVIEKKLKKQGVKTVHFISPSIWAWREKRIKKIKKSTDLVICILPFEVDFYKKHKQNAVFVGHPLTQILSPRKPRQQGKNILLMPGSRGSEIKSLLAEMLQAITIMSAQDIKLNFHLVLVDNSLLDWVNSSIQIANANISVSIADAHTQIAKSDLVILASGTAALEVALIGVPMIVIYKLSAISHFIVSRLLTTKYISLPNLIANKQLVPELIQNDVNGANIAKHALRIINTDNNELIKEFSKIYTQLKSDASVKSAQAIINLVNNG